MHMKKMTAFIAGAAMALSLAACSTTDAPSSGLSSAASSPTSESSTQKFTLQYPAHMQELGYTNVIEMDKMPERIVCMTTYPVMTLYQMGVKMLAVPTTSVLDYPEDLDAEQLPSLSSENFSLENIVDLEPDLVMMAAGQKADYGETLESLGVPVYYVATNSQTHNVYDVIREQSQSLVDAFSMTEELTSAGETVMAQFDDLDNRVDELKTICDGKTVLILLAGGVNNMYLQTEKATLGCMAAMCGLESIYHNDQAASMIPLDMETALEYDPDLVLITGSGSAEDVETLMQGIYDLNPDYWNSIHAIKNGQVIYLPGDYVSTAGINIINNIQDLANLLEEYFAA